MINGITEKEREIINNIINKYPYEFYAYGSRVKGDFTKGSDLDILIKSDNEIPIKIIEELKLKFNESRIPYIVNITIYSNISDDFYNLIKKDLIKLWIKQRDKRSLIIKNNLPQFNYYAIIKPEVRRWIFY